MQPSPFLHRGRGALAQIKYYLWIAIVSLHTKVTNSP